MPAPDKNSPFIVPLFIPHLGCPHRCIFCNQRVITGASERKWEALRSGLGEEIERWLARKKTGKAAQAAFYGGSFTALPLQVQIDMLRQVQPFLRDGRLQSIRLSTRPDAVNETNCSLLRENGVKTVELGVQSMNDAVLAASGRGHTSSQVEVAFKLLRKFDFSVGGQLMLGLPADTVGKALTSAEALAALGPDFVRIYPTVVVRGSALADLYREGHFRPLSLSRAVVLTSLVKEVFDRSGIAVIRMGLQQTETLTTEILAGPHHAAFGELVLARQYFKRLRKLLAARQRGVAHRLSVAVRDQSILRGQGNANWRQLERLGHLDGVRVVFERNLTRNEMRLTEAVG